MKDTNCGFDFIEIVRKEFKEYLHGKVLIERGDRQGKVLIELGDRQGI